VFSDSIKDLVGGLPEISALMLLVLVGVGAIWIRQNWRINKYKVRVPYGSSGQITTLKTVEESAPFAWNRLAIIAAFAIGSLPVLTRPLEEDLPTEIILRAIECLWVLLALWAVTPLLDRAILWNIDNYDELVHGNKGLGMVHAGFYVGFGFILRGSLIGSAPSWQVGLLATAGFAVLGTAVMIGSFYIYERLTPWNNVHKDLEQGYMTSAVGAGGALASTGMITSVGVAGDFTTWPEALVAFAAMFLVGIVVQVIVSFVVDHVFMPNCSMKTIQHKNQPVEAGKLAGANVIVAFILMSMFMSHL
jgi:uncharacterized membrane protein YjfL (UPF0719 family)